jgi:glycosyltransferase involved in cell wall biosynthesis
VEGHRIAFLNWRCPSHPLAGGAERYVWEVATRFAQAGAEVTLVTARAPGLAADETRDGVRIRRRGGPFTVYPWAALFLLRNRRRLTAVVDGQNGIPFFAPVFLLNPAVSILLLIHHVHQDQFGLRFSWPLSALGRVLEGAVSRLVYRAHLIVVVSPSTRTEVRRKLRLRGPIYVVPNGMAAEAAPPADATSSTVPRIAYVGRLVPHKRLDLLLEAVAGLHQEWPGLHFDVAGDGPARAQLERKAEELGLRRVARFWGRVTDVERTRLLASAWLMVTPSDGEGWGLTVTEANAAGCPALARRVPGLVDSIQHGVNGWLVDEGQELATGIDAALRVLAVPEERERYRERCRLWASRFTWERTALRLAGLVRSAAGDGPGSVSDVATVVVLEASSGLERARQLLRTSDLWTIEGNTLRILFQGEDERGAISALQDLGLSGRAEVRVARVPDLLFGPSERGWP